MKLYARPLVLLWRKFFNDTDVLVSMTEEEKNMLSQWNLLTPAQRTAVINIIGLLLSCD